MALQTGLGVFCGGLATMLLLVLAPGVHLHADDLFDDIYRRGAPMNARLRSLSASFTETTSSTLLAVPVVATGRVVARRPSTVRLTYDTPDPRVVLIADGQLTVDWPARGLIETRDVRPSLQRAERHFFDKSPAELRKLFDVTAAVASDRPNAWHLTFVPKRRQLRHGLDRLHLWIDQETLLLQALLMEMPGGDTRLMEFNDLVVNPAMAPEVFVRPSGR